LCTNSSSCYAIFDVPKVIYNGNILSKVNNLWQKSDGTYLLKLMNNTYHTDLAIANYAVGRAGNNLFYDSCQGKSNTWSNASLYCHSKGMRLPELNEAKNRTILGVPSCSDWTWTNYNNNGRSGAWKGLDSGLDINSSLNVTRIRCVK